MQTETCKHQTEHLCRYWYDGHCKMLAVEAPLAAQRQAVPCKLIKPMGDVKQYEPQDDEGSVP